MDSRVEQISLFAALCEGDLNALKHGWAVGFGDEEEFIDYFFERYDRDDTRVVVRNVDGVIVAQMHVFVFDDEVCEAKGCYIYGVTTLPECRGKGIAAAMIGRLLEAINQRGIAYAVLIAATSELRAWYSGLGFVLRDEEIQVRGLADGMNFAMDDSSLNRGMYYVLDDKCKTFSLKLILK